MHSNGMMPTRPLTLAVLPGHYAICRLEPDESLPGWAAGAFLSLTRTAEELSVVCDEAVVPDGVQASMGWALLRVAGPLDFALTGVLASLAVPLAEAGVSIFAVSTYDTDYLLVPASDLERARSALAAAGHMVRWDAAGA